MKQHGIEWEMTDDMDRFELITSAATGHLGYWETRSGKAGCIEADVLILEEHPIHQVDVPLDVLEIDPDLLAAAAPLCRYPILAGVAKVSSDRVSYQTNTLENFRTFVSEAKERLGYDQVSTASEM